MRLSQVRRLLASEHGVIAVQFALLLPVLFAAFGFAIDQARYYRDQSNAQAAADAAALAAAMELSLVDRKYEDLAGIVKSVVDNFVNANGGHNVVATTKVNSDPLEVEVFITTTFQSQFPMKFPNIRAKAVARVVGKPNICVLGLNEAAVGTISLEQNARVTGQNCAVYSNSDHTRGLKAKNSASLSATTICSRGGKDGGPGNFSPTPLVDCPSFEDPLISRPEPQPGDCDPGVATRIAGVAVLSPGTYCGLELASGADVTLSDGIFIFKDGPLVVRNGATLTATGAGLYFIGAQATFTFEQFSTISLSAPTSGPMSGLLVFTARSQNDNLQYKILSDDARVMVGTIYIPKGELTVDATSPIADQSAYTAIVADKIRLYGGPHLVLNTNYSESQVPVPDGIMGAGQPVMLTE